MRRVLGIGAASLLAFCALAATEADNPPDYQHQPLVPPGMEDIAAQAVSLFANRRYAEATKAFEFILQRHPRSLWAWSNLGATWITVQDYDQAHAAFQRASELAPDDPLVHEMLSITYYQQREFPAAEKAARRALEADPRHIGAMRSLAMALATQNRLEAARRTIEKALAIEPDNPDLLHLRDILSRADPGSL